MKLLLNLAKFYQSQKTHHQKSYQFGGAAMEYILVTTFATVIGIAALGFVGKVMKDKLSSMAGKLGVTTEDIDTDIFKTK